MLPALWRSACQLKRFSPPSIPARSYAATSRRGRSRASSRPQAACVGKRRRRRRRRRAGRRRSRRSGVSGACSWSSRADAATLSSRKRKTISSCTRTAYHARSRSLSTANRGQRCSLSERTEPPRPFAHAASRAAASLLQVRGNRQTPLHGAGASSDSRPASRAREQTGGGRVGRQILRLKEREAT